MTGEDQRDSDPKPVDEAHARLLAELQTAFEDSDIVDSYVQALDREADQAEDTQFAEDLRRLARADGYTLVSYVTEAVQGGQMLNGKYFLKRVQPETGEKIAALPHDDSLSPLDVDTADSLVWVCEVDFDGTISKLSDNFTPEQAQIIMWTAYMLHDAGYVTSGTTYIDLSDTEE